MINQFILLVNRFKYYILLTILYLRTETVLAVGGSSPSTGINFTVDNPLTVDSLPDLVEIILGAVVQIGVPIVALGIIYSGFLFIKARGNADELKKAREAFTYIIVGSAIVLGAFVILTIIQGTIAQLGT